MKKFLVIIMAMAMIMPVANAQNSKALKKALKKEYKTRMKDFKKEGWKVYGTARTLDVSLLRHYDMLEQLGEKGFQLHGISAKSGVKSAAEQQAENDAARRYAEAANKDLKARMAGDLALTGTPDADFSHFYSAYEAAVEKNIAGELRSPTISLIREETKGVYEVEVFYIVNEDAATRARIRAAENAAKESAAAQKYAEQISEFVKAGFKVED